MLFTEMTFVKYDMIVYKHMFLYIYEHVLVLDGIIGVFVILQFRKLNHIVNLKTVRNSFQFQNKIKFLILYIHINELVLHI